MVRVEGWGMPHLHVCGPFLVCPPDLTLSSSHPFRDVESPSLVSAIHDGNETCWCALTASPLTAALRRGRTWSGGPFPPSPKGHPCRFPREGLWPALWPA